jgi:hypothetical protein
MEFGRIAASWATRPAGTKSTRPRSSPATSISSGVGRRVPLGTRDYETTPAHGAAQPAHQGLRRRPAASRTLVDVFSGDSPSYGLLKHPVALVRTVRETVDRLVVARYDEFSLHAEEVGEYHQREVVSRMGEEGGGGVHVLA